MSSSTSSSTSQFSTYPLPELLNLWERNKLTEEQMIGQRSAELTSKPAATSARSGTTCPPVGTFASYASALTGSAATPGGAPGTVY